MKTKKERSLRELLIVLRENQSVFKNGLCVLAYRLAKQKVLTFKEVTKIQNFITRECKKNKKYYIVENDISYLPFYFPINKWEPREKWLDKWIKKLETTKK